MKSERGIARWTRSIAAVMLIGGIGCQGIFHDLDFDGEESVPTCGATQEAYAGGGTEHECRAICERNEDCAPASEFCCLRAEDCKSIEATGVCMPLEINCQVDEHCPEGKSCTSFGINHCS